MPYTDFTEFSTQKWLHERPKGTLEKILPAAARFRLICTGTDYSCRPCCCSTWNLVSDQAKEVMELWLSQPPNPFSPTQEIGEPVKQSQLHVHKNIEKVLEYSTSYPPPNSSALVSLADGLVETLIPISLNLALVQNIRRIELQGRFKRLRLDQQGAMHKAISDDLHELVDMVEVEKDVGSAFWRLREMKGQN